MKIIDAIDVNEAYCRGLRLILSVGRMQDSRAGKVIALDDPLAVVYRRPLQRVLFDPTRDANPFFHFFESLWLLAGRNDAKWLDRFVSDFSSRFAEEDGTLHGSYGFRWRKHFDVEGGGNPHMPDQLDTVVKILRSNPDDRRVVIQMWDPTADLRQQKKDVPCNLMAVPRIVNGKLELTVFNRSNDAVWGMFGANAVQFSFLLEYLAGRIGVMPGTYTQISTNAHVYFDHTKKLGLPQAPTFYPETRPIGTDWEAWDEDLKTFMVWTAGEPRTASYNNTWFKWTAEALWYAHNLWHTGERQEAFAFLKETKWDVAPDWKAATLAWMERRLARMAKKQEAVNG